MAADPTPRVAGLLASTVKFKEKVVLSPDLWIAIAAGVAVFQLLPDVQLHGVVRALASAGVSIATALVGVVIAALAVVVAFLDDEFLQLMDQATRRLGAIEGQLFPFWFVTGLGVLTILASTAASAFLGMADLVTLRWTAAALALLIVWTALGVLNLVGYLTATGVSRAAHIRRKAQRGKGP